MNMLGDLEGSDEYYTEEWVVLVLAVFFVTIVMMNLLVGLLSERLGCLYEFKTPSDYFIKLGVTIELESYYSLFRRFDSDNADSEWKHLCYAEKNAIETDEFQGHTLSIKSAINASNEKLDAKFEAKMTELDTKFVASNK